MIPNKPARQGDYFDRDWYGKRRCFFVCDAVITSRQYSPRLHSPERAAPIAVLRAAGIGWPFLAVEDGKPRAGRSIDLIELLAV